MVLEAILKDRFSSESKKVLSCFNFYTDPKSKVSRDSLFAGSICGNMSSYPISQRSYGEKPPERKVDPIWFPEKDKHYSQITCILVSYDLLRSFDGTIESRHECVITGSMDRTIKIWAKITVAGLNYTCIQTLTGHNAKISSLLSTPHDGILSCSFDGTIRIYCRNEKPEARPIDELVSNLRYYLFECMLVVSDTRAWLTSSVLLPAISPFGNWTAYLSTSDGDIHVYRSVCSSATLYENKHPPIIRHKTWLQVHPLEITTLLLIPSQSFIITLSNDKKSKIIDSSKGVTFFSIESPRCRYTNVQYLEGSEYLIYSDEMGYIELVSLNKETSISKLSIIPSDSPILTRVLGLLVKLPYISQLGVYKLPNFLFTLTPNNCEILLYELTIHEACVDIEGHHSSIIGISTIGINQLNFKLHNDHIHQNVNYLEMPILSIEANGNIKCWDDYDNKFRFELPSVCKQEVTSVCVIWSMNAVITGHENGYIAFWNLSTATKQSSKIMQGAMITAIVVATLKSTDIVMIAADSKGRIAMSHLLAVENRKVSGELGIERMFFGHHQTEYEHSSGILSLVFCESYNVIISGGEDCTMRLWRINSNGKALKITGHLYGVSSIHCCGRSEDEGGCYIMTGDEKGFIMLWKIIESKAHDCGIELELVHTLDELISTSEADDFAFPNISVIVSCVYINSTLYISQSSRHSDHTLIWKINLNTKSEIIDTSLTGHVSDMQDMIPLNNTNNMCVTCVRKILHHQHVVSYAHLNIKDPLNPLSCNRLYIGTSTGLILKYYL